MELSLEGTLTIVGYMGSGKSTLGRVLAGAMNREFVDLDRAIVKKAGMGIPEIFDEDGEDAFRDLEHETLLDAIEGRTPSVVACGGGIVVREDNRALLRDVTTVFLREDIGVLYGRTRGPGRPLRASSRDEFERRYAERLPLYREVADIEIVVDGRPTARVAEEVLACLSKR